MVNFSGLGALSEKFSNGFTKFVDGVGFVRPTVLQTAGQWAALAGFITAFVLFVQTQNDNTAVTKGDLFWIVVIAAAGAGAGALAWAAASAGYFGSGVSRDTA